MYQLKRHDNRIFWEIIQQKDTVGSTQKNLFDEAIKQPENIIWTPMMQYNWFQTRVSSKQK
jgi:hypothetical protein